MIGEDQWDWLEEQLTESDASVHVLVSTLQVGWVTPSCLLILIVACVFEVWLDAPPPHECWWVGGERKDKKDRNGMEIARQTVFFPRCRVGGAGWMHGSSFWPKKRQLC